jgi:Ser/Thr protein kinase RdoA (MazF antagonist)
MASVNEPYLPVTHSQLQPAALTSVIGSAYDLRGQLQLTLLRSWTNDVYALSSEAGHFVLKVYRATWRRPPDIEWEVHLQDWLRRHGAPVASVIPLATGDLFGTLHAPEGVRGFALFEQVPGAKPVPPWSTELYHDYGRAAALVHAASTGFSDPRQRFERTLVNLLDESLREIQPWLSSRPDDLEMVERVAEQVRGYLTPLLPALDWGICHGDLSLDNLHVQSNGQVTLYDFDLSCYGWRAWDVCNALGYAAPEHHDACLRGYHSLRAFSADETAAVSYFTAADALRMMGGEVSRWAEWSGSWRVDSWVDDKLEWLRAWDREHQV